MDAIRSLPSRACPVLNADDSVRSVTAVGRYPNTASPMTSLWVRSAVVLAALAFAAPAMAQPQWWYYVFFEAVAYGVNGSPPVEGSFFSGIISFQSTISQQSEKYDRYEEEFERELEAKFGVEFYSYVINSSSKQRIVEELSNARAQCEREGRVCFLTNWVPGTELHISGPQRSGKVTSVKDITVPERLFSPQARDSSAHAAAVS